MLFKFINAKIPAFILIIITINTGYSFNNNDDFSEYREPIKNITTQKQALKHYNQEEKLINKKLTLNLSQKERSILRGLRFIINTFDDDNNFKPIFSDFLLLMGALSHSHGRIHQKEVVEAIIKKSLIRAQDYLSELFDDSENEGWHFIALFPLVAKYPKLEKTYINFYNKQWPDLYSSKAPDIKEFTDAIKNKDYKHIFDLLFITSFAYHYEQKHKKSIKIPEDKNKFIAYLKEFEKFSFKNHQLEDSNFRDLAYLATHIPFFMTNYGELPLDSNINSINARKYIESSLAKVRKLGDFDLYAEYIECLKLFNPSDSRIPKFEKFLYDLQRKNGSWGSAKDFNTTAYTSIHPTGAALMALNIGS